MADGMNHHNGPGTTHTAARTRGRPRRRHLLLGLGRRRALRRRTAPCATSWRRSASPPRDPEEMQRSLAEARLAPWRRLLPPVVVAREGQELPRRRPRPARKRRQRLDRRRGRQQVRGSPAGELGRSRSTSTASSPAGRRSPSRTTVPLGWHTLLADNEGTVAAVPAGRYAAAAPDHRAARRNAATGD